MAPLQPPNTARPNIWAPLLGSAPVKTTCKTILRWRLEVQQCWILEEVRVLSCSTHFGKDGVKISLLDEINMPCDSSRGDTTSGSITALVSSQRTDSILPLIWMGGTKSKIHHNWLLQICLCALSDPQGCPFLPPKYNLLGQPEKELHILFISCKWKGMS